MSVFTNASRFIYKNARPLDYARFRYLFEQGDKQEVIRCLSAYQNNDGGFGSALEPDCHNPNSTPMQTWVATRIIEEIGLSDPEHPLISGIVRYLCSGDEFDGHRWHGLNTVSSNNDYPHAPWWTCTSPEEISYNPTASLAGFLLTHSEPDSEGYVLAERLVTEAYSSFANRCTLDRMHEQMHELSCFVELYDYLMQCENTGIVNMEQFRERLSKQIGSVLTYDTSKWRTEYVCKPSQFVRSRRSDFYDMCTDLCEYECNFITDTQNADGTWDATWSWDAYPEQWHISKHWWLSDIIIRNLVFYNNMRVE